MGTVEEMAYGYACNKLAPNAQYDNSAEIASLQNMLIDFTQKVLMEYNRWRDPKEELPKDDRDVLVKTTLCARYCIAFYKANGARNYHWHENNGPIEDDMVIGWREIHE